MDIGLLNQPLALKHWREGERECGGSRSGFAEPLPPQSLRGPNRKETAIKELLVSQFLPC